MDNRSNSRANTCPESPTSEGPDLLDQRANPPRRTKLNHSNFANRRFPSGKAMGHSNFCPISCDVSVVD